MSKSGAPYLLGVYEKAFPDTFPLVKKLDTAKACGYDFLELSIDESGKKLARLEGGAFTRELNAAISDSGLGVRSICLSAHRKFPLGTIETEARALDILRGAAQIASSCGADLIQLAGYDVYYGAGTEETAKRFADNLFLCVDIAKAAGVRLGFETMETPFLNTVQKAMGYVNAVGSPLLGVYPDIGNVTNANVDVTRDLETGRGHIFAAHLKEVRAGVFREVPYGEGRVDFAAAARSLKDLNVTRFNAEFWYDPSAGESMATATAAKNHTFLSGILDGEFL